MKTQTKNPNKEACMRNLIGTAVAVVLSMMLLPSCCSTANAGVSVSMSVGTSAGCQGCPGEGYVFEDCSDDGMDWDNVIILNDNQIGFWVLLENGNWALRCRSMWYNSGSYEWTFGPWWYDYSISYVCHCHDSYVSYSCPFHGVRFHNYMSIHYRDWHNRYFVYSHDRYQPIVERRIIVNRGRYFRHDEPAVYRHPATIEKVRPGRTVTPQRTTVITRERAIRPQVRVDDGNRTELVQHSGPATSERTTTITRSREIRQPVSNNGGNRTERINTNQGNSRQTEMTRTRTTTRERSNGNGNSSTRTDNRSSTRTTHRGR
jgi:hypothetical protein